VGFFDAVYEGRVLYCAFVFFGGEEFVGDYGAFSMDWWCVSGGGGLAGFGAHGGALFGGCGRHVRRV